jgi:Sec-independent protein secretion pathway component TatC
MLAVPMWLLYELGIIVAKYTKQAPAPVILPPK